MLQLIPAPAHRFLLCVAHDLRKRWWRLRRPVLGGCRVIAIDVQGRVLMVRHSYAPRHWALPGGGMHRGEDPVVAGRRELLEETGCRLENARLVDEVHEKLHGADNHVSVVAGRAASVPEADLREIIEVRFFEPGALAPNVAPAHAAGLPEWLATYADQSRES